MTPVNEDKRALWQIRGVALCAEAQADGVPCSALGRDCETCAHALPPEGQSEAVAAAPPAEAPRPLTPRKD